MPLVQVQLVDGRIYASSFGYLFSEPPEFIAFEFDRLEAERAGTPVPPGPLRCVLDASSGRLAISGTSGCMVGIRHPGFSASWTPTGALVERAGKQITLPIAELRDELRAVVETSEHAGGTSEVGTGGYNVSVAWTCDGHGHATMLATSVEANERAETLLRFADAAFAKWQLEPFVVSSTRSSRAE